MEENSKLFIISRLGFRLQQLGEFGEALHNGILLSEVSGKHYVIIMFLFFFSRRRTFDISDNDGDNNNIENNQESDNHEEDDRSVNVEYAAGDNSDESDEDLLESPFQKKEKQRKVTEEMFGSITSRCFGK